MLPLKGIVCSPELGGAVLGGYLLKESSSLKDQSFCEPSVVQLLSENSPCVSPAQCSAAYHTSPVLGEAVRGGEEGHLMNIWSNLEHTVLVCTPSGVKNGGGMLEQHEVFNTK